MFNRWDLEITKIFSNNQFERLFRESFNNFFDGLHRYAFTLLKDNDKATDAVQSIFTKWWEAQTHLRSLEASKAYLYTAVYRHCLNLIRHEKVKTIHSQIYAQELASSSKVYSDINSFEELSSQVESAIESLPPQCQLIFRKSRIEGKRYTEIAREMDLSIKTIETQIGKALRILRERLRDYL